MQRLVWVRVSAARAARISSQPDIDAPATVTNPYFIKSRRDSCMRVPLVETHGRRPWGVRSMVGRKFTRVQQGPHHVAISLAGIADALQVASHALDFFAGRP